MPLLVSVTCNYNFLFYSRKFFLEPINIATMQDTASFKMAG